MSASLSRDLAVFSFVLFLAIWLVVSAALRCAEDFPASSFLFVFFLSAGAWLTAVFLVAVALVVCAGLDQA